MGTTLIGLQRKIEADFVQRQAKAWDKHHHKIAYLLAVAML
jgi:hypothetical protein